MSHKIPTTSSSVPRCETAAGSCRKNRVACTLTAISIIVALCSVVVASHCYAGIQSIRETQKYDNCFRELNENFRTNYRAAGEYALANVTYLLVVERDEIVLFHKGQRVSENYTPVIYHLLKSVAHLPISILIKLSEHAGQQLTEPVVEQLAIIRKLIQSAREHCKNAQFDKSQLERQLKLLDETDQFISRAIDVKKGERGHLDSFVSSMRPLVMENVREAAERQLDGLHAVVQKWKKQYGDEFLKTANVVVMGSKSARRQNLAMQYFARVLHVEIEDARLIFAESVVDEQKAVELVGTRLLDEKLSKLFFGDKERLQRDLLADAAKEYIPKLVVK